MDAFVLRLADDGRTLVFGLVFGGSGNDEATSVSVSPAGDIVVVGNTDSSDLPLSGEAPSTARNGPNDGFILRLGSDGTVVSSTYFGGTGSESLGAVGHDQQGNLIVAGRTTSPFLGSTRIQDSDTGDVFVAWLDGADNLGRLRTVAGAGFDAVTALVIDGGSLLLAGYTESVDFAPGTPRGEVGRGGGVDGFLLRLTDTGAGEFLTLIGGPADDRVLSIALDADGGRYFLVGRTTSPTIVGESANHGGASDGFVAGFGGGDRLEMFDFLGGRGRDEASGAVVDNEGVLHIVGLTDSPDFRLLDPIAPAPLGGQDGFIQSFSREYDLVFSSLVGGSRSDGLRGVTARDDGGILAIGMTNSSDVPIRGTTDPPPDGAGRGALLIGIGPGAENECVFIVDDSGSIQVWDVTRRVVTGAIEVGTSRESFPDVTISPDGSRLFVLNAGVLPVLLSEAPSKASPGLVGDRMIAIDTSSFRKEAEVSLPGLTPVGAILTTSPDGQEIYAANVDRVIQFLDSATLEAKRDLGLWPISGLEISPDGAIIYTAISSDPPSVSATDLDSLETIDAIGLPAGVILGRMAASTEQGEVYVLGENSAEVFVLSNNPLQLTRTIRISPSPRDIAVGSRLKQAYVAHGGGFGSVSVLEMESGETVERVQLDSPARRVALTEDETLLIVATEDGRMFFIETVGNQLIDVIATGMRELNQVAMVLGTVPTGCEFPPSSMCAGDCDASGGVTISELILAVNIALGVLAADDCTSADADEDGQIGINDLVSATRSALFGC